jgi:four helix bundle protein
MTYKRFEDLPVWQQAIQLAGQIHDLTESPGFKSSPGLRDQLERAALSISGHIAEGFERGTTKELSNFASVALGSAGEVRSVLCFLQQRPALHEFKSQISNLKSAIEACSRQLRAWAASQPESDILGRRQLDQLVRKRDEQKQKALAMQKRLLADLPAGHPLRQTPSKSEI